MEVTVGLQSSIGTAIPKIVNQLKHSDNEEVPWAGEDSYNFQKMK